jgi:hypothetical protein
MLDRLSPAIYSRHLELQTDAIEKRKLAKQIETRS